MKQKALTLSKISLGVILAAGLAACNQKAADKPAATTTAPAVAEKPQIVYINEDTVTAKYEYAKDMRKRLDDKGKSVQSDIGGRRQALQREAAEAQKNVATMSADQRATAEQHFQREAQTEQAYEQNASAQLQTTQADEAKKLYDKVYAFAKQYAKDNGYKMIMTFQSGNAQLLYGDESLDVTADFLKKLNDAYTKDKK